MAEADDLFRPGMFLTAITADEAQNEPVFLTQKRHAEPHRIPIPAWQSPTGERLDAYFHQRPFTALVTHERTRRARSSRKVVLLDGDVKAQLPTTQTAFDYFPDANEKRYWVPLLHFIEALGVTDQELITLLNVLPDTQPRLQVRYTVYQRMPVDGNMTAVFMRPTDPGHTIEIFVIDRLLDQIGKLRTERSAGCLWLPREAARTASELLERGYLRTRRDRIPA